MRHQRISQEESYLRQCSMTFPVDQKTMKKCLANAKLVSLYAKRFGKGQWSFIGPGSEKKWYCISEDSPQGVWDTIAERMLVEFEESGHPFSALRAHCPEVDSEAKAMENCRDTMQSIWKRLRHFFRIIVSANQLSLYGAIAEICEEYETLRERTVRPVVMGQSSFSLVLSVIKTEVPLDCDDPANQDLLLQQYGERIEKLSQQDKLSKFCMDAGFLNNAELGQYFMTKDTGDFTQLKTVACREYTLPRDEETSEPKGWIRGNTNIDPVLEVTTCCLQGKYGVEIRIWSLNRDNTHSWVRISHGSNKFVMNLNNNEQEISRSWMRKILHADQRPKQNHKEKNLPALPQEQFLLGRKLGLILNQGNILSPIMKYRRKCNVSSSSFTTSASRRRWSRSILEN